MSKEESSKHTSVLAAKSPMLRIMFTIDIIETINKTNQVSINDIEQDVFQQLLKYIYTGIALIKYLTEIFIAAGKYQMDELKEECKEAMEHHISTENCIDILVLANQINVISLESKAIEFINKKNKIDDEKLNLLPKKLLIQLYCDLKNKV